MVFDAREVEEVFKPPTFISKHGRKYVGQHISVPEWMPLERQLQILGQMGEDTVTDYTIIRATTLRITKKMFPKPWWQFWTWHYRSVAWHVLRLAPIPQMRALWDFLQCQAQALGREIKAVNPGTKKLLGIDE